MKAMILAAGRGERMAELTTETPKPLLRIGRESLIERHLRRLAEAGVREVVVNLSYRGDQIRSFLGDGARWGVAVHYSEEGEPPLETAGGIVHALPLLGSEPFMLVNADVLTDFDFRRLRAPLGAGILVLVDNPPHHPRGDFGIDAQGVVTASPPTFTFAGISVLEPRLFEDLGPGRRPLKPILDEAVAARRLHGLRFVGTWLDVGTSERLEAARALMSTRRD